MSAAPIGLRNGCIYVALTTKLLTNAAAFLVCVVKQTIVSCQRRVAMERHMGPHCCNRAGGKAAAGDVGRKRNQDQNDGVGAVAVTTPTTKQQQQRQEEKEEEEE